MKHHPIILTTALIAALLVSTQSSALQLQDIVRLKGSETSKLVGMGLVVGLKGTGDGGKYAPAMRALAQAINRLNDPNVELAELKDTKNVALVSLSAELPREGVREGDLVDVHVSSIGAAKSLQGGRLLFAPLAVPPRNDRVFAFAEGPVRVEEKDLPTVAVVRDGAQLTRDVMAQLMDDYGRITLVLDRQHASWPVAFNLANRINDNQDPNPPIAKAIDQKNIIVNVPIYQRQNPAVLISQILQTYIDPSLISVGARVVINERTGTIVIGGDVRISPVLVSKKGLTVTMLTPPPPPDPLQPQVVENPFIRMDPEKRGAQPTTGPKLSDLEAAFNQLKVQARDRIEIIKLMHESGYLHGQLILK